MTPRTQAIWRQILDFPLDQRDVVFTFSARLARENRWSADYADRVLMEYKRFVLLAVTAGHPVTPSDQVDQAWHLHLAYTEGYWNGLCTGVLGQSLHHHPTQGGPADSARFRADYQRTLASYRLTFGYDPPADIWPDVDRRFAKSQTFVRIDAGRHWIWRKPRGWALRLPVGWRARLVLSMSLVLAASCLPPGNPFNLRGQSFLWLFLGVWGAATAGGLGLRWLARNRFVIDREETVPELEPEEVAYLVGGAERALDATVAGLVVRDLESVKQSPERLADQVAAMSPSAAGALVAVRDRLISLRLLSPPSVAAFVLALLVPVFGLVKVAVGFSRGRPVPVLILLCLLSFVAAIWWFRPVPQRTRSGRALVKRLTLVHGGLAAGVPVAHPRRDSELPLAVGLFGASVLAPSGLPALQTVLEARRSQHGATDGGGGCGGNGGCGGDGGCGGGCGGCGGCGGGE